MLPSSFLMPAGDTTSRYIEAIYLAHEDLVVNSRAATVSWVFDAGAIGRQDVGWRCPPATDDAGAA